MTVNQLKKLLKRAEKMGWGEAAVTFDSTTRPLLAVTRFAVTDAEVHQHGLSLLDPTENAIEIRLVGQVIE